MAINARKFKRTFFLNFIWLSALLFTASSCIRAQNGLSTQNDTIYTLIGDTLFSNQGFHIFIGQPLVIGNASGERGWYNTILFKSGASWPLVFLKKAETDLDPEYQMDPTIRERDKVKEHLKPGDTLVVTKFKRFGKKKSGYWYMVSMRQKQGVLSLNFNCEIISAIRRGEVLLPK